MTVPITKSPGMILVVIQRSFVDREETGTQGHKCFIIGDQNYVTDRNWKFQRSKENQTHLISKSIFVINFPNNFSARDLWNVCNDYEKVNDVFIPFKKSKEGKCLAFVRFIKVDNVDHLVENLCTICFGCLRLHANVVRFQREHRITVPQPYKTHVGNPSSFLIRYSKLGIPKSVTADQSSPALVLDDSYFIDRNFSMSLMIKVNNLPNLYLILEKEGFQNLNLTYLRGLWVLTDMGSIASKEKIGNHTRVGSWFYVLKPAYDGEVEGSIHGTNVVDKVYESSCIHANDFFYENSTTKNVPGFIPNMKNEESEQVSDMGVYETNERVMSMPSKPNAEEQVPNGGVNV
ncbi:hypothetical protein CTI12_AA528290 [Artemisia annua]|uniref:RRM domain-containing protein n=1 Tax=Artemisia annua TaxID=35608 RepID=A0A2U1L5F7_ARTAN|nr:hypothetical protein CTI12_AA528290 [Artemisia annua]